jgi:hypothetical protein
MKMAVFWVFAPCSLLNVCRWFTGACYSLITVTMEAASTCEMSVCSNPEDSLLQPLKCSVSVMSCFPNAFSRHIFEHDFIEWFAVLRHIVEVSA